MKPISAHHQQFPDSCTSAKQWHHLSSASGNATDEREEEETVEREASPHEWRRHQRDESFHVGAETPEICWNIFPQSTSSNSRNAKMITHRLLRQLAKDYGIPRTQPAASSKFGQKEKLSYYDIIIDLFSYKQTMQEWFCPSRTAWQQLSAELRSS